MCPKGKYIKEAFVKISLQRQSAMAIQVNASHVIARRGKIKSGINLCAPTRQSKKFFFLGLLRCSFHSRLAMTWSLFTFALELLRKKNTRLYTV